MTKSFPYLALDSAGERTILCDYPVPMFDNTTKETTKMKTLSRDQLSHYVGMAIKNPIRCGPVLGAVHGAGQRHG